MYKGYTFELDTALGDYAFHVRYRGLIEHTTSYFTRVEYAMQAAIRWIDSL